MDKRFKKTLSDAEYEHPVLLFDGVCNYCNAMTNFIIRQDKKKVFRFATLQSNFGQKILKDNGLPTETFESFLLLDKARPDDPVGRGKIYKKSTAGLRLYNKLPWYWKWTQLLWIFPRFIRDWVYGIIAKNRYKWFGKREECMIPTPELKERFLE